MRFVFFFPLPLVCLLVLITGLYPSPSSITREQQIRGQDIGIIAPYVAQISLLTRLLNTDTTYRKRFEHVLGQHRAMQLANIEIKTVDGFEGREKEVIIFSTVRNNPQGHIGFLADRRRLNVGLTRAKRGLFVVGSIDTLKTGRSSATALVGKGSEAWRRYAQFLNDRGLILQLSGDKLKRTLFGNYIDAGGIIKQ
jgi:superfamily I DNA and/or RNA helicase